MKKNLFITLVILIFCTKIYSRPIISKNVDDCRRNAIGQIRCAHTEQKLVTYPCPTDANPGKQCDGWILNCSGAGFSSCKIDPNSATISSTDPVDNYWSNQLLEYAYNQIEINNNLNGTYSSTVIMPNQTIRIYNVAWNFTLSTNGSISGSTNVSCND
jgi:hypothetical protein